MYVCVCVRVCMCVCFHICMSSYVCVSACCIGINQTITTYYFIYHCMYMCLFIIYQNVVER